MLEKGVPEEAPRMTPKITPRMAPRIAPWGPWGSLYTIYVL